MEVKLVVKLPDDLRRRARARAALEGKTLSDIVRARLEEYAAGVDDPVLAREFAAWEAASDDALVAFEASLE